MTRQTRKPVEPPSPPTRTDSIVNEPVERRSRPAWMDPEPEPAKPAKGGKS